MEIEEVEVALPGGAEPEEVNPTLQGVLERIEEADPIKEGSEEVLPPMTIEELQTFLDAENEEVKEDRADG